MGESTTNGVFIEPDAIFCIIAIVTCPVDVLVEAFLLKLDAN